MSDATELNLNTLPPPPRNIYAIRKRKLVRLLLLLMALWPVIAIVFENYVGDSTAIAYLLHLGLAVIVYFWCKNDAANAGKQIPPLISLAIIVVPEVGFPIYKVRIQRTPMGEAISVTFAWILLYSGIAYAAAYLLYYFM